MTYTARASALARRRDGVAEEVDLERSVPEPVIDLRAPRDRALERVVAREDHRGPAGVAAEHLGEAAVEARELLLGDARILVAHLDLLAPARPVVAPSALAPRALQPLADAAQAFAVGRVGAEGPGRVGRDEVARVPLLDHEVARHPRGLRVEAHSRDRPRVQVARE